jgi:hypothetical protein
MAHKEKEDAKLKAAEHAEQCKKRHVIAQQKATQFEQACGKNKETGK